MHMEHDAADLSLLRCFVQLHHERHLTRAAARAQLSQPAMSRALARLRDVFDDPLFVRTPRGMLPTPRADQLLPRVTAVLDAAASLVRTSAFSPATLVRSFVIATSDMFEIVAAPRLVEAISREAPGVSITTRAIDDRLDDSLAIGSVDLAVSVRAIMPASAMCARVFDDAFVTAVRAGLPGVGKKLTLDQFCALPHLQIAPSGTPGGVLDDALDRLGRSRRVMMRTAGFLSAPAIVASSDLILTAPSRVLTPLARPFHLRLMPTPLALPSVAIWQGWHPRVHEDPAHAWFRAQVAAALRGDDDDGRAVTSRSSSRPSSRSSSRAGARP